MPSMQLRIMTESDIPAGLRLKEIAGWNQTAADWIRFLQASPQGCFVADVEGQVCGTATTIGFDNRFAWVGMVLVDPEFRGRGIGTKLLAQTVEYLDDLEIPTIKLDATPQGKPLYKKLGFVAEYEIERWTLRKPSIATARTVDVGLRGPLPHELWEPICETDRELFGADRSFLLKSLHEEAPHFTTAFGSPGKLDGYAFARRGSFADQFGPAMARDPNATHRLLEMFLARSSREILIVDCMKSNTMVGDALKSFGFTYSRPLTRMYRGSNDSPGQPELVCAVMGPEFG